MTIRDREQTDDQSVFGFVMNALFVLIRLPFGLLWLLLALTWYYVLLSIWVLYLLVVMPVFWVLVLMPFAFFAAGMTADPPFFILYSLHPEELAGVEVPFVRVLPWRP